MLLYSQVLANQTRNMKETPMAAKRKKWTAERPATVPPMPFKLPTPCIFKQD
jgi:hypothetical protein